MLNSRTAAALVLLTASVLLFTACGDDASSAKDRGASKAEVAAAEEKAAEKAADEQAREAFEKGLLAVGAQLDAVGTQFEAANDFDDLAAAATDLGTVITSLNALTPPEAVKTEHADMVKALRSTMLAAKRITETSTEASDEAAMKQAQAGLDAAAKSADAITSELA